MEALHETVEAVVRLGLGEGGGGGGSEVRERGERPLLDVTSHTGNNLHKKRRSDSVCGGYVMYDQLWTEQGRGKHYMSGQSQ